MIPKTTVNATQMPMATAVRAGTGTGPRASTSAPGACVGQHLEAGRLAVRRSAPSRPEASRRPTVGAVAAVASPSTGSPTSPTGENMVTARRR